MTTLNRSAQKVQDALQRAGIAVTVREFPESTRTAVDAAAAIGCDVAQIAKSLIFRTASDRPLLVIASGSNRVSEAAVAAIVGESIKRADAAFARESTGYAIGGIPPLGHVERIRTLIDRDLLSLHEIWAAAGTPNAVFRLTPAELVAITGGEVADIAAT